jgi:hypothetical protein
MFEITKYALEKDGRSIVLQGMAHFAPKSLYNRLQKDLDAHLKKGFTCVYEGISGYPRISSNAGYAEKDVRDFFKWIFALCPQ